MIGETVLHYRILEDLGRGGMGVVYKAEDTRLGRPVALKFLSEALSRDPQAVERFQREARAASALNHPHICTVHDIGEYAGRHFIAMELLQGASLQQQIADHPLSTDRVLELAIQMTDALDAAHHRNIVHRDIKPANIFVTERGQAKLLDFGLAKAPTETLAGTAGPTQARLTETGVIAGTLAYMSPEQVRGETLDSRTDIFSLGAVLYEMTTGRQAFPGATSGTIQEAILNREPLAAGRVNPALPARLEEIINKALEKDRPLRYQHASEMRADLQRLKRDTESANARIAGSDRLTGGERRWWRRTPVVAGVLAVGALMAMAIWLVFSSHTDAIDSIAVLPFVNSSGNPDSEYLSDGITESLINNLSQLPTLRVTARSTAFRYKGNEADPQKIGRDLGVRAVLSGRLSQRGETLVISTELMDVSNGSQLWGGQYTHKAIDVFALQDELSTEISEKLRVRLTRKDRERLTKRYTDNPAAYQMYLRGRYYWNKRSPDGVQKAIEYFNRAVEADPAYALAYAGLADTYNLISFFNFLPPREATPKARAAAARALEIDGDLAEAHISLAYVSYTFDWDWPEATRHINRALALNRDAVMNHSYYPFYLSVGGRFDEAIRVAKSAADRDPLSAAASHNLAVQLALARRFDDAIEECRRTIAIDPNYGVAHDVLAGSLAAKGMYREALSEGERAVAANPASAMFNADLAYVRARLGQTDAARRTLDQLTSASAQRYTPALAFAVVHVGLGEYDQAMAWLEKAYAERFIRLAYLRREVIWDPLRPDPRFQDLARRIGLPE
jgi:serine/threonine protein kinase/Tfp pilus assembly protein PilF